MRVINQIKQHLGARSARTIGQGLGTRNPAIAPLVLLPQPNEALLLMPPMWMAVGAASIWHKLASDIRNPLELMLPAADDREALQGLAVRFNLSKLTAQEATLFGILVDASLYNSGFLYSDLPLIGCGRGENPGEGRIAWAGGIPGAMGRAS